MFMTLYSIPHCNEMFFPRYNLKFFSFFSSPSPPLCVPALGKTTGFSHQVVARSQRAGPTKVGPTKGNQYPKWPQVHLVPKPHT